MESARLLTFAGLSDPVSSVTHLAGALVFASMAGALLRRGRGSAPRLLSLSVFAFSCVLLLSLSGAYHLLSPGTEERALLKQLDHAAIFLLIAASFTPVHTILFRGAWRWGMLAAVWGAALAGVILKTLYFD
ncbi:MAG: PAQR family membrane homeostasis protein TrhA, partial [Burkholderiales bacterium]